MNFNSIIRKVDNLNDNEIFKSLLKKYDHNLDNFLLYAIYNDDIEKFNYIVENFNIDLNRIFYKYNNVPIFYIMHYMSFENIVNILDRHDIFLYHYNEDGKNIIDFILEAPYIPFSYLIDDNRKIDENKIKKLIPILIEKYNFNLSFYNKNYLLGDLAILYGIPHILENYLLDYCSLENNKIKNSILEKYINMYKKYDENITVFKILHKKNLIEFNHEILKHIIHDGNEILKYCVNNELQIIKNYIDENPSLYLYSIDSYNILKEYIDKETVKENVDEQVIEDLFVKSLYQNDRSLFEQIYNIFPRSNILKRDRIIRLVTDKLYNSYYYNASEIDVDLIERYKNIIGIENLYDYYKSKSINFLMQDLLNNNFIKYENNEKIVDFIFKDCLKYREQIEKNISLDFIYNLTINNYIDIFKKYFDIDKQNLHLELESFNSFKYVFFNFDNADKKIITDISKQLNISIFNIIMDKKPETYIDLFNKNNINNFIDIDIFNIPLNEIENMIYYGITKDVILSLKECKSYNELEKYKECIVKLPIDNRAVINIIEEMSKIKSYKKIDAIKFIDDLQKHGIDFLSVIKRYKDISKSNVFLKRYGNILIDDRDEFIKVRFKKLDIDIDRTKISISDKDKFDLMKIFKQIDLKKYHIYPKIFNKNIDSSKLFNILFYKNYTDKMLDRNIENLVER